ncbi:hypothetical protein EJB05_42320, partial [Eragrostis curvula]
FSSSRSHGGRQPGRAVAARASGRRRVYPGDRRGHGVVMYRRTSASTSGRSSPHAAPRFPFLANLFSNPGASGRVVTVEHFVNPHHPLHHLLRQVISNTNYNEKSFVHSATTWETMQAASHQGHRLQLSDVHEEQIISLCKELTPSSIKMDFTSVRRLPVLRSY